MQPPRAPMHLRLQHGDLSREARRPPPPASPRRRRYEAVREVCRLIWATSDQKNPSMAQQFELEGLMAKRPDSLYESGRRSGAWVKVKLTQQQEFVIGGYTPPRV